MSALPSFVTVHVLGVAGVDELVVPGVVILQGGAAGVPDGVEMEGLAVNGAVVVFGILWEVGKGEEAGEFFVGVGEGGVVVGGRDESVVKGAEDGVGGVAVVCGCIPGISAAGGGGFEMEDELEAGDAWQGGICGGDDVDGAEGYFRLGGGRWGVACIEGDFVGEGCAAAVTRVMAA